MKKLFLIAPVVMLTACATGSVQMLNGDTKIYESESCRVEVYQSQALAIAGGMTEEVCRVNATTAFSLDHRIDVAISRAAEKVCGCGVARAYIDAAYRDDTGLKGTSKATLVGFK